MLLRNSLRILNLLALLIFSLSASLKAQHALGIINSNNAGISSVVINPANIADSRFWVDVQVFSFNFDFNQNLGRTKIGLMGLMKNNRRAFNTLRKMYYAGKISAEDYVVAKRDIIGVDNFKELKNQGLYGSVDIMGPSVMFNVLKKIGVAFSSRARMQISILDKYSDGNLSSQYEAFLASPNRAGLRQTYNLGNLSYTRHRWAEFGFSVAAPIMQKGRHFLKAGLTFKRLIGYRYKSFRTLASQVSFNPDGSQTSFNLDESQANVNPDAPYIADPNAPSVGNIVLQGYMESLDYEGPYKFPELNDISNYFFNGLFGADKDIPTGAGFDIGFVYEFRPKYERQRLTNTSFNTTKKYMHNIEDYTANKYKARWSISLKDFGYIRYKGKFTDKWWYNAESPVTIPLSRNPNSIFVSNYLPVLRQVFNTATSASKYPEVPEGTRVRIPGKGDRDLLFYLPATFVTQLDVNVWDNVYVNASLFANLITKYKYATRMPTVFSIAARYETSNYDVSVPFTYNVFYRQLKMGLGFNLRQIFFLGFDDIAFLIKGFKGVSLYTGIKIPMRKREPFARVFDYTKHYNPPIRYNENRGTSHSAQTGRYRNFFRKNALERNNKVLYKEALLRNEAQGSNVQSISNPTPKPRKSSIFKKNPL